MALPTISRPLFTMTIPSSGKTVQFRPFLVREEKILLIAQQSQSDRDITSAIKQVLTNCIVTNDFDPEALTTFDLEYMFLNLRSKSVNNIIEVSYTDLEDNQLYRFTIDLDTIEVIMPEGVSNKIKVTDEVGIIMKYPSVNLVQSVPEGVTATEVLDYLIRGCIDQVYDADTIYKISEEPVSEVEEFIDSLDVATFDKIREFFENIPKMYHKIEYKNKLGHDRVIELTSLRDFFTWG